MGSCIPNDTSRVALSIGFRPIDVTRNKIVTELPSLRPRYVALTYVWGEDKMDMEMLRTLKVSVCTVEDRVKTIDFPKPLPRTIGDAIEITRSLGFTYLWVDSLCIIQDDREDRHNQISMMDEIYKNATLTIAAGSSPHANWGLPGIRIPRSVSQQTERIGPHEFTVAFPRFEGINYTGYLTWDTRGWTLQEKILSKRLLLFTDLQIYFRCGNFSFAEDTAMETGSLSHDIRRMPNPLQFDSFRYDFQPRSIRERMLNALTFGLFALEGEDTPIRTYLPTYAYLIKEYTQRSLTYKKDSLDAISGVLRALDPSELAFCAGLPRKWLPLALLWQPEVGCRYSIDYDARTGIPSWSWAAWSFSADCSIRSLNIEPPRRGSPPPMMIHYKDSEGRLSWLFEDWTSGTPNELLTKSWTELSATARQQLDLSGTLLGFQTCVGVFGIKQRVFGRDSTLDPEDKCWDFYLTDEAGRQVEKISTCRRVARKPGPHQFIALSTNASSYLMRATEVDLKYQPKKSTLKKKFTYIGCSHTRNRGEVIKDTSEEVVLPQRDWSVTDVMLVEWRDDVAFRVAVGHVISTAFDWKPERIVHLG